MQQPEISIHPLIGRLRNIQVNHLLAVPEYQIVRLHFMQYSVKNSIVEAIYSCHSKNCLSLQCSQLFFQFFPICCINYCSHIYVTSSRRHYTSKIEFEQVFVFKRFLHICTLEMRYTPKIVSRHLCLSSLSARPTYFHNVGRFSLFRQ